MQFNGIPQDLWMTRPPTAAGGMCITVLVPSKFGGRHCQAGTSVLHIGSLVFRLLTIET